jgi:hypothetical protein
MALENYESALNLALKTLSNDNPEISEYRNNIAIARRHLQFDND